MPTPKLWGYDFEGTPRECMALVKPLAGVGTGYLIPDARALDTRRFHDNITICQREIAAVAAEGANHIKVHGYGTHDSAGVHITTLD